tara:strand:+ start:9154 stop:9561 length:408 start_codon:yes stop_codon:yes gene_type:complete
MSTLNVDKIIGVSTAGSITVTGEGTKTTNLQQGLAKAWVHYGTITNTVIRDSFNISSLDDTAAGKTVVHIQNDFVSDDYCATMYTNAYSDLDSFDNHYLGGLMDRNVGDLDCWTHGSSGYVDSSLCDVLLHGDLA